MDWIRNIIGGLAKGVLDWLSGWLKKEKLEEAEDRAEALAAREESKDEADAAQDKIDAAGDGAACDNPEDVDTGEALEHLSDFSKEGES